MSNYYKIGWFILAQTISILLGVGIVKICYTPEVIFGDQKTTIFRNLLFLFEASLKKFVN
jgi:hypothetical protein